MRIITAPPLNTSLGLRYTGRRWWKIIGVVLHDTAGSGTHNDTLYVSNPQDGRRISADFTVERDGEIYKLNPQLRQRYCFHAGRATRYKDYSNASVTRRTIGIEICHSRRSSITPEWPQVQVDAVAHLCAWLVSILQLSPLDITSHRAIITDGSRDDPIHWETTNFWAKYWDHITG